MCIRDRERAKGLITASAGNHAQGVAYAAKCYGCKAVIVMPTTTPPVSYTHLSELSVPVKYIGIGETIDDLQKFDSDEFVNALFDTKTE